jgi:pimeloyl-ACP methyl ester carboxylesterase
MQRFRVPTTRPRRATRWGGYALRRSRTRVGPYQIHAVELGDGPESLVLVHGLCGSSAWWRRVAPLLAHRYRVVAPDVIGFGRSRCPGRIPSMADLARHLRDWFELRELGRPAMVGHSMGGEIAVHLAARDPAALSALVLADAAGIPRAVAPHRLLRFAAGLAPPRRWGDPRFLPVIASDAMLAGPRVVLRAIGQIVRDDVRPMLSSVRTPTLIVWGEHDTVVPLADAHVLHRGIRGSRLVVIPGAAHNPMVDRPAAFAEVVLSFLESRGSATEPPAPA